MDTVADVHLIRQKKSMGNVFFNKCISLDNNLVMHFRRIWSLMTDSAIGYLKFAYDIFIFYIIFFPFFLHLDGLLLSGQVSLEVEPVIEFKCQRITFTSSFPSQPINVQLSLHEDEAADTYEAAVSWIEQVSQTGFTGCVATSGPIILSRRVDLEWIAFDVVPTRCMAGIQSVSLWTTGTKCVTVLMTGMVTNSSHVI